MRILMCLLFVSPVFSINVDVHSEWKTDLGWEVTCAWRTLDNDTLQSVRLYNNGQQFMIYRPEKHGPSRSEVFRAPDRAMIINCETTMERGRAGRCVLILEPYQPPTEEFTYTCEVSGERPMFRIGKKDYTVKVLVPPTPAQLTATVQAPAHVTLNCTSAGLPAPGIQWTVGKTKVEADFTERKWNVTSKLWDVWSSFSYTRTDNSAVVCTPENSVVGVPAEYNSTGRVVGTLLYIICGALSLLLR
ncbi:uncharacterized protein LOC121734647 [Aricia agestis]|uniref:uncharacterized protein LOC121734647 n=1 Tax=Aricia agestis TaxID=91739 RepID=UPI001C209098|nr:uncharacterized protein LOC121734647 [Aricia agestis]